jgi:Raf kinase inhibitor-like YbhB/YbcL family protein
MNSIKQPIFIRLLCLVFSIFLTTAVWAQGEQKMTLTLKSTDFAHQGEIPKVCTCDGNESSPALSWSGVSQNTKSLVLIVDDPDAPDPAKPKMTWVHWVLYNIPPTVTELPRAIAEKDLPAGIQQGKNDWKRTGYRGPCPPTGKHRYFHKLYALNTELSDLHQPDKSQLEKAMEGHIIEQAELSGTYQR